MIRDKTPPFVPVLKDPEDIHHFYDFPADKYSKSDDEIDPELDEERIGVSTV